MATPLQLKTERLYQKFKRGEVCLHIMDKDDLIPYLEGLKLYKPQLTRHIAGVEKIIEQDKINSSNPFWVNLKNSLNKKKEQGFTSKLKKWIFNPFSKSQKENLYTVQQQNGYSSLPKQEIARQRGPRALLDDQ